MIKEEKEYILIRSIFLIFALILFFGGVYLGVVLHNSFILFPFLGFIWFLNYVVLPRLLQWLRRK
jgi:hypothetical protein